jgi:hypothetical protein
LKPIELRRIASKVFLFTPSFSLVLVQEHYFRNRFNGFRGKEGQTVETVFCFSVTLSHQAEAWCE